MTNLALCPKVGNNARAADQSDTDGIFFRVSGFEVLSNLSPRLLRLDCT